MPRVVKSAPSELLRILGEAHHELGRVNGWTGEPFLAPTGILGHVGSAPYRCQYLAGDWCWRIWDKVSIRT